MYVAFPIHPANVIRLADLAGINLDQRRIPLASPATREAITRLTLEAIGGIDGIEFAELTPHATNDAGAQS